MILMSLPPAIEHPPPYYAGLESPVVEYMCRDIDLYAELGVVHEIDPTMRPAAQWEVASIQIITSGSIGKGPVDIVMTDCGALGWAHFQPVDPFGLGIQTEYECPREDPDWVLATLAILYSQYSTAIQFRTWRGLVSAAVGTAESHGWTGDNRVVAAVVTNSTGPSVFYRMAGDCGWEVECVIDEYGSSSAHRTRRSRALRAMLDAD